MQETISIVFKRKARIFSKRTDVIAKDTEEMFFRSRLIQVIKDYRVVGFSLAFAEATTVPPHL
jgi:type II secretory pathway component PulC